jgi:hypothetical protein
MLMRCFHLVSTALRAHIAQACSRTRPRGAPAQPVLPSPETGGAHMTSLSSSSGTTLPRGALRGTTRTRTYPAGVGGMRAELMDLRKVRRALVRGRVKELGSERERAARRVSDVCATGRSSVCLLQDVIVTILRSTWSLGSISLLINAAFVLFGLFG